jgi:hypothetical protein
MKPIAAALLLLLSAIATATPAPRKTPSPRSSAAPLDFSGFWRLDTDASRNINPKMKDSTLSVTQKGNRIWISPGPDMKRGALLSEEIVADGRPYEKLLGPAGKGIVTAEWAPDGQSLRIESRVGTEGDSHDFAIQRSIWKLSSDRNVWVRESTSVSPGRARSSQLVFRKVPPPTPTVVPTRPPGPRKTG